MAKEELDIQAQEIANKLRAAASPKEIFQFKRKHMKHGRESIREEADNRMDDDLENRDELVERVTDIVIKGLEKLPG